MFQLLKTNLKHFIITFLILLVMCVLFGLYHGADAVLSENPLAYKFDKEGPHVFFKDNSMVVKTIRGDQENGFYSDNVVYLLNTPVESKSHFTLEEQDFEFVIDPRIETPPAVYNDNQAIIAISDIESSFQSFRNFLIANKVIDKALNWIFGKGHLVLVGDFVDRGNSVTQVLWFIYKLEQASKKQGGQVHFIIGNHEIKNMQGNFLSASEKYYYVSSILEVQQDELYGVNSFLGRWLASKNVVEKINGRLFVHGGIHPKLSELGYSLPQINQIVRSNYRKPYYPSIRNDDESFLVSTKTGPAWYRGYFKDSLSQTDIDKGLNVFNASAVVVGHTLQWSVKKLFQGKVFAIDVKHPKDYQIRLPPRSSEGLLIEGDNYYRLTANGTKELL